MADIPQDLIAPERGSLFELSTFLYSPFFRCLCISGKYHIGPQHPRLPFPCTTAA
uniref:Uncharacterized protein n=1 Tax=Anguilla anguilla TaxID=7936 RepID=A0A0E9VZF6_ANGAN